MNILQNKQITKLTVFSPTTGLGLTGSFFGVEDVRPWTVPQQALSYVLSF